MKLDDSTDRRNANLIQWFAVGVIVAVMTIVFMTKPKTDLRSANVQADHLLAAVGGPTKVCIEANEIFRHFGVAKERFLDPSDLKDYPSIAGIGTAHILPGSPPRISIRVGNHINGFTVDIFDTNNPEKHVKSADDIELVGRANFFL